MPSIRVNNVAAGTANALDGLQFQVLDMPALVSIYASTAVATGAISYSVGSKQYLDNCPVNTEQNADEVNTSFDQVLFRQAVPAGKQFLPVATQVCNVLVVIEYIGGM